MISPAGARAISSKRPSSGTKLLLARAVRRSLNLPRLTVQVRRGPEMGSCQTRLCRGPARSAWLTLRPGEVAVIRKVALLPPRLLGHFRLAYADLISGKS